MVVNWTLTQKDYQREYYEAQLTPAARASVRMRYHTFRKWWSVTYSIEYGPHTRPPWGYNTPNLRGEDFIKTRKEARTLAQRYMAEAGPADLKKLSPLHQNEIAKDAATVNPGPKKLDYRHVEKVKRAAAVYHTFVARPANVIVPAHLPIEGKSWDRLCAFRTVVYVSNKWGPKGQPAGRYYHPFGDNVRRSVYKVGDYLIGVGLVRVTKHGIEDVSTWFKLTGRSGATAKDVLYQREKVWAKLATLEAMDLPCAKGDGCLAYVPPETDDSGKKKPGTDAWRCPKCGGSTPKFRHGPGSLWFDAESGFLIAAARVQKTYRSPSRTASR